MIRLAAAVLQLLCFAPASAALADAPVRVVVFSAPGCAACELMEREVWSDPEVVAWLRAHATVEVVEVDQDPQRTAAFGIEGVPTVVVMRGEQELGRVTRRLPVILVLPWLEVLRTGGVPVVPDSGTLTGAADAVRRAAVLATAGACDEALPILRWAWERRPMDDPAVAALRWHVLADAITDAEMMGCAAAHDFIEGLREQAEERRRTAVDPAQRAEALVDWLRLGTRPVGGADLRPWLAEHADDPELHDAVRRHLWPCAFVLGAHEAWELLARLTPSPQGEIRKALALDAPIAASPWGAEDWAHVVADHQGLVADVAVAHLVAGDTAEAVELVTVAPGVDDRAFMIEQVVKRAIRLGRPLPVMLRWLEEDPSLEPLRPRLVQALERLAPAAPVPSPAPGPVGPLGPAAGQPASRLVSVTRSSPAP